MNYPMSQGQTGNIKNKKSYLLNPQVKVIFPQAKMLQERFLFRSIKCPQASEQVWPLPRTIVQNTAITLDFRNYGIP